MEVILIMAKIAKDVLAGVARNIYGVEISDSQLEKLTRIVQQSLDALDKSCDVGLEDVEPAIVYDSSRE